MLYSCVEIFVDGGLSWKLFGCYATHGVVVVANCREIFQQRCISPVDRLFETHIVLFVRVTMTVAIFFRDLYAIEEISDIYSEYVTFISF